MRKLGRLAIVALLIISSVAIEWLFLTGAPPSGQALAEAFLPAAPRAPVQYLRPDFQTGVVFPRWGASAYTSRDPNYSIGLGEIQDQTAARWIELTINLQQATYNSTSVYADPASATPASLAQGVAAAHAHGFKVFIEPLLSIEAPTPDSGSRWAGAVHFPNHPKDIGLWFESYWQALKPYMEVAQRAHVEQMAIATELEAMEGAPAIYWYWLIAQARSVYSGRLTYDMNFTSLTRPVRSWMRAPGLVAIGISFYRTISTTIEPRSPEAVAELWAKVAGRPLDVFAQRLGRPIFLSEIGYRNSADALRRPYAYTTDAPPDPALQAAAYNAALLYVLSDPYIHGIYFWGWSMPPFSPNWLPAARTLKGWYTSPMA